MPATEKQFNWFIDLFEEKMQERVPEDFADALTVFNTLCDEY